MKHTKAKVIALTLIIGSILFTACNIRIVSTDDGAVETAVAQTLVAKQQEEEEDQPVVLPTITSLPTITPKPDQPTNTPQPCNKAYAVSETYPDNTEVEKGTDFDKSWRLQNIGTCTWNANYRIAFFDGDQMNGPASKKLGVSVAPGEVVDIILDLDAPNSVGTYKGIWKLQDDSGDSFATVWVQIKAVAGAAPAPLPPAVASITLSHVDAEGGSVRSSGTVKLGLDNVGDTSANEGSQGFVSFDISGIPAGATITQVTVNFSDFDELGDAFANLGCLRAYIQNYNNLDASDYYGGSPTGAISRWCSAADLQTAAADSDYVTAIQNKLGDTRFQIRLQFNDTETNNDANADMVRFGSLKLIVTYELP